MYSFCSFFKISIILINYEIDRIYSIRAAFN